MILYTIIKLETQNSCYSACPRKVVCYRCATVKFLYKRDKLLIIYK